MALVCQNYHVYGRPADEVDVVCTAAMGDSLGMDLRTTLSCRAKYYMCIGISLYMQEIAWYTSSSACTFEPLKNLFAQNRPTLVLISALLDTRNFLVQATRDGPEDPLVLCQQYVLLTITTYASNRGDDDRSTDSKCLKQLALSSPLVDFREGNDTFVRVQLDGGRQARKNNICSVRFCQQNA